MYVILDCDTDSIIIKRCKNEDPLPTSTALGALKEEIRSAYGDSAFAETFFSTGAKSYGLLVNSPRGEKAWISRSKGFQATHRYQKIMNPESILKYLHGEIRAQNEGEEEPAKLRVSCPTFRKELRSGTVRTELLTKKMSLTLERKRYLMPDCVKNDNYTCYPFGFL